jgi:acetylornithine deacetylase/succinyl-diaminopimelate desuccinylase-like protein
VKLIRTGPPGHGSIPHGQNALEKMIQGINRILGRENPLIISDVMAEYFKQMGAGWDFLKPYLDDNEIGTLIRVLRESGLADLPQISAMIRNTVSVTMMAAGTKTNVIPSRVEAELDVRILPGQDPDEFVAELKRQLADEDISVEITTKHPANESPMDSSSFSLIKTVIAEHFPDALVVPSLLMAVSDSRFFRDRGISCYGVFPVLVQMDDFQRIHGLDEKISEENMIKGTEVYTDIVKKLCNL